MEKKKKKNILKISFFLSGQPQTPLPLLVDCPQNKNCVFPYKHPLKRLFTNFFKTSQ